MILSDLLLELRKSLGEAGVPNAAVNAEAIISHVLGRKRAELYLEPLREIAPAHQARIMELAEMRRRRVPLQYVLGEFEFMSLRYRIKPGAFIPRPETEVLVETLIAEAELVSRRPLRVLDIGTGSGMIAVSLARYTDAGFVLATDVSAAAIETAQGNAILNGVSDRVAFVVGSYLGFVKPRCGGRSGFDLIACNPPYVARAEMDDLQPEVKYHEPRIALDGGLDGLEFVRRILPDIPSILNEGGVCGFEIAASQTAEARRAFEACGFREIRAVRDLLGLDRVVVGRK